jgi:hypothetical protein
MKIVKDTCTLEAAATTGAVAPAAPEACEENVRYVEDVRVRAAGGLLDFLLLRR